MARLSSAFVIATILIGGALPARADFDAAADFSAASNPNGVWSYGQAPTLGGTFSTFMINGNESGVDYWGVGPGLSDPVVFHNGTSQAISFSTIIIQPGQLAVHPGPQDEYAIVRFVSPDAGNFSLATTFTGIDVVGTTTDVHVLLNGVSLFSGLINGFGSSTSYGTTLTLEVGDILDFEVGYGSNGNYLNDSTAISVQISPNAVPEPGSIMLLGMGLVGGLYAARRRAMAA